MMVSGKHGDRLDSQFEGGSSGLLVVLQMIGEAFDEEKFLKVGHIFEQTLRGSGFLLPTQRLGLLLLIFLATEDIFCTLRKDSVDGEETKNN
ncbi:hypothetical protein YC2023_041882 [Brassica napus]